jgi:SAM-dependent methyltransferase
MPESILRKIQRGTAHLLFGTRGWTFKQTAAFASQVSNARILEIGSGRRDMGEDRYTVKHLFSSDNEFVQSDVNPEFGHQIVDVTSMDFEDEFDVILCLFVLEHVFDFKSAVEHMHRALRPGGRVLIAVPHLYPYHDEPIDFWRFTEYSLRTLLDRFSDVDLKARGMRKFPLAFFVVATK